MKCICGSDLFYAKQTVVEEVMVGEKGEYIKTMDGDPGEITGPFRCVHCKRVYDELSDEAKRLAS